MNCPKCNTAVTMNMSRCGRCGQTLVTYKKAIRISNSLYNEALLRAKIRDLSGSVSLLKMSLKYYKGNTDARNLLGLVYYEMGETVLALSQWVISKNLQTVANEADRYIKIIQEDREALEANNQMIKKFNSALLLAKQGNDDLALVQLKKVVGSCPNFVKAQQLIALLYIARGEYKLAMSHLKSARMIDINNATTIRYIKEVCERDATVSEDAPPAKASPVENRRIFKGDSNIEVKPVGSYKKERPRAFPLINVLIGVIIGLFVGVVLIAPTMVGNNTKEQAEEVNDYGTKLAEKDSKIKNLESEKAGLEDQIKQLQMDLETAKKDQTIPRAKVYAKILEAYDHYAKNEVSAALAILDNLDTSQIKNKKAKEIIETIRSQDVKELSATAFENGRVAYNSGKYDEAEVLLQEALDLNPDNYDAMYFFGRLNTRRGNIEKAVEYYKTILERFPDVPRASEARARLRELGVTIEQPTPEPDIADIPETVDGEE